MFDPIRRGGVCVGIACHDGFVQQSEGSERNRRLNDRDVRTTAETAITRTAIVAILRRVRCERAHRRCHAIAGEDLRPRK